MCDHDLWIHNIQIKNHQDNKSCKIRGAYMYNACEMEISESKKSVSQVKSEKIYCINDDKKIVYMRTASQPKSWCLFFSIRFSFNLCVIQNKTILWLAAFYLRRKNSVLMHIVSFKYQIVWKLYGNRDLRSEYGLIVINKCKLYFRFLIGTPKWR